MDANPNKVVLSFLPSKDCKHSRQFKAVAVAGATPVLDCIYVNHSFSAGVAALTVTLEKPAAK